MTVIESPEIAVPADASAWSGELDEYAARAGARLFRACGITAAEVRATAADPDALRGLCTRAGVPQERAGLMLPAIADAMEEPELTAAAGVPVTGPLNAHAVRQAALVLLGRGCTAATQRAVAADPAGYDAYRTPEGFRAAFGEHADFLGTGLTFGDECAERHAADGAQLAAEMTALEAEGIDCAAACALLTELDTPEALAAWASRSLTPTE